MKIKNSLIFNHKYLLTLVILLGLILKLSYLNMIEFSYDPALFSEGTVKILESWDFLRAKEYYPISEHFYTQSYNVGHLYFYLNLPFFGITKNPVVIAAIYSFLSCFAILACYAFGKKYFNKNVGLIASALYAVSPWSIIFFRYLTPYAFIQFFVLIFIFYLFDIVTKEKSNKIAICLISMAVLIELVQWGLFIPVIFLSTLILFRPKINWKFFLIGLSSCLILLSPHIFWDMTHDYHDSGSLIKALPMFFSGHNDFSKFSLSKAYYYFDYYLKVGSAQKFEHHLGDAINNFQNSLTPVVKLGIKLEYLLTLLGVIFVLFKFTYNKIKFYYKKDIRRKFITDSYALLLLWVFITLLAMIIFHPKGCPSLPRYYLFFFPSQFIFIALFLDRLIKYDRFKNIFNNMLKSVVVLALLLIIISNCLFINQYFKFLIGYKYNNWLSSNSDIPYKFSYDALSYVQSDSKSKGYQFITVSDDIRIRDKNNPNPGINYLMHFVFNNWHEEKEMNDKALHYFIISAKKGDDSLPQNIDYLSYKKFGPYYVFSEKDLVR